MTEIDTADTVYHKPSRETWRVAFVEHGRLWWCGWPEGCADLADCELVWKATPGEKETLLRDMANMQSQNDARKRYAMHALGKTANQSTTEE